MRSACYDLQVAKSEISVKRGAEFRSAMIHQKTCCSHCFLIDDSRAPIHLDELEPCLFTVRGNQQQIVVDRGQFATLTH
jgi:hypothetical protein